MMQFVFSTCVCQSALFDFVAAASRISSFVDAENETRTLTSIGGYGGIEHLLALEEKHGASLVFVFAVQVIRFRTCFGSCPREKATAQKRNVSPETVVSGPECFAARRSNLQSSPPTVTASLAEAARSRPELVTSCLERPHSRTTSRRLKAPVLSDVQRERGPIEYRKISSVMLFF